jgi:hypothetical protein
VSSASKNHDLENLRALVADSKEVEAGSLPFWASSYFWPAGYSLLIDAFFVFQSSLIL